MNVTVKLYLLMVIIVFSFFLSYVKEQFEESYPQHLVDVWFNFPLVPKVEKIEIDCHHSKAFPVMSHFYFAPIFTKLCGHNCYVGSITRIPEAFLRAPDGRYRNEIINRNGVIFSRWDTINANYARRDNSFLFFTSFNEGEYLSLRRPHDMSPGDFTYGIKHVPDLKPGTTERWYCGYIIERKSKETISCGYLRFDDIDNGISSICSFAELYSPPYEDYADCHFTIGKLRINDEEVKPTLIRARYFKGFRDYAKASYKDGLVSIDVNITEHYRVNRNSHREVLYDAERIQSPFKLLELQREVKVTSDSESSGVTGK
jgi:hypothetical protein